MSTFEAIILGFIQGLTEFLPVSSSGHLKLAQFFLGFQNLNRYIIFDLVCHLGTLLAIFLVFFKQIAATLSDRLRFSQIILATLPLFPLVLMMKPIRAVFDQPQYLGYCFLITAILLYAGIKYGSQASREVQQKRKWIDPLTIGLFQAVAVFPGISRSGSTISSARLLGWAPQDALSFSFLLSIPAILGGATLEILHLLTTSEQSQLPSISWITYAAGFLTSFLVGYAALRLLMQLALKDRFVYFAWYCLFLGITTFIYFNYSEF